MSARLLAGLALAAALACDRGPPALPEEVHVHEDLLRTLPLWGEWVAPTEHLMFGTPRAAAQIVEADRRLFSRAQGLLSRPHGEPPFAWLVGDRVPIDLDVLHPANRELSLVLAGPGKLAQQITLHFNGMPLGEFELPADGSQATVRVTVPARLQLRGANRVEILSRHVESRQLLDEPVPLPIAGAITRLDFVRSDQTGPAEPSWHEAGVFVETHAGEDGLEIARPVLTLPGDTAVRLALELPARERVLLSLQLVEAEVPLEISLWPDGDARELLHETAVRGRLPRQLECDLSPWAGRVALLELRTPPGAGTVRVEDLAILASGLRSRAPSAPAAPPPGATSRPSILLVVLDALARRRCSCFGHARPTTPNLDALAARSTMLTQATAPASYTLASIGTLLTAQGPLTHGVALTSGPQGTLHLAQGAPCLAAELRGAGWRTAALVTNPNAGARHGYAAGFERFDELFAEDGGALFHEGVDGRHLPPRLTEILREAGGEPFFAYVHVFEPHAPYAAPDDLRTRFVGDYDGPVRGDRAWLDAFRSSEVAVDADGWRHLGELYDARVAQADRVLGALLDVLAAEGRQEDTIVCVVSDHGESLGEDGWVEHGDLVSPEELDVPLVLHVPGRAPARLDAPATLADIAPTLLALAGLPRPATMEGLDLLAASRDGLEQRLLVSRSAAQLPQLAATQGGLRLVVDLLTRRRELYDLRADPGSRHDLAQLRPAARAWLERQLAERLAAARARPEAGPALAQEERELLGQIGYAGRSEPPAPAATEDPGGPRALLQILCARLRRL